jgi:hypothetical protein
VTEYPCPFCATTANLASGCPGCGRPPDDEAAEVIRLAGEIGRLIQRVREARREYDAAVVELTDAQRRRNVLAAGVRARTPAPAASASAATPAFPLGSQPGGTLGPLPAGMLGPLPAGTLAPEPERKVSFLAVQSVLFVLGGLLLGTGAIVFTAVAWATFGITGRAAILAGVTVLALAAPVLALRRGLTGTAETFAAVGLLLVLLDGYAAWSVDLAGIASLPRSSYAAAVCAVTASVAVAYGAATRLTGPRFAAFVVAQPVIPLAAVELRPSAAGWALVLSLVAIGNLVAGRLPMMRVAGWAGYGLALAASAASALWSESTASDTGTAAYAGVALLTTALVLLSGAVVARQRAYREIAGGVLVVALVLAAGRVLALTWPGLTFVLIAGTVAAVAIGVSRRPTLGPWIGALACLGSVGVLAATMTGAAAVRPDSFDWQLPVSVASLAAGLIALLSAWEPARVVRPYAVIASGVLVLLALPAGVDLLWWSTATLDLAGAAGFAGAAALSRSAPRAWVRAGAAAVLAAHAVGVSSAAAGVLGAVVLIGVGMAALAHRRSTAGALGGVGLAVGVAVWPVAVAATLRQADVVPWWVGRGTLIAAAVLPPAVAAVRRWWPEYLMFAASATAGATAVASLWWYGGEESAVVYASAGALLVALVVQMASRWLAAVAVLLGLRVVGGVAPVLWELVGSPYRWLADIWSGTTEQSIVDAAEAAIALALLAVAATLLGRVYGLLVAPFALLAGLVAGHAPWPAVPLTSLLLGLAGSLAVALGWLRVPVLLVALPLAGAGLAGTLPTEATTLAGLALVLVTGAVSGASGHTFTSRISGWLVAVAAAVTLAAAAAFAIGVDRPTAAFWTLGAAAAALALGGFLSDRRESRAVDAAAHAAAVVAFLLTLGAIGHAAAVCTLWGVATGVRAFRPAVNRVLAGAAAGCELLAWWLLLASHEVALIEAYTVPAAAVALLAGLLVRRAGTPVRSWVAYGPALAAAFLPSLASILADPDAPLRRLALGLGALAVLVVGSERRNQAGVVAGGALLAVSAGYELALVWQLLPSWIPLTGAGLLLVWLAVTYERRRRDLARLRAAVHRMS